MHDQALAHAASHIAAQTVALTHVGVMLAGSWVSGLCRAPWSEEEEAEACRPGAPAGAVAGAGGRPAALPDRAETEAGGGAAEPGSAAGEMLVEGTAGAAVEGEERRSVHCQGVAEGWEREDDGGEERGSEGEGKPCEYGRDSTTAGETRGGRNKRDARGQDG